LLLQIDRPDAFATVRPAALGQGVSGGQNLIHSLWKECAMQPALERLGGRLFRPTLLADERF
jgi:hypothetical protein